MIEIKAIRMLQVLGYGGVDVRRGEERAMELLRGLSVVGRGRGEKRGRQENDGDGEGMERGSELSRLRAGADVEYVAETEKDEEVVEVVQDYLQNKERVVKQREKDQAVALKSKGGRAALRMWENFRQVEAEERGVRTVSSTMDDLTKTEREKLAMKFAGHLLDEEDLTGKQVGSAIAARVVFFNVYRTGQAEAFKHKDLKDLVEFESRLTLVQQQEQARDRLVGLAPAVNVQTIMKLVNSKLGDLNESRPADFALMKVMVGCVFVVNWGIRIGHVSGPLRPMISTVRDHSVLWRDVLSWWKRAREVEWQGVRGTDADEMVAMWQDGAEFIDFEFLIASTKTTRQKAQSVAPARAYRVGTGTEIQADIVKLVERYIRAARLGGGTRRDSSGR